LTSATSQGSGPIALFAVASLLLTFFVALNTVAEPDTQRVRDVAESFLQRHQPLVPVNAGPVSIVRLDGEVPAARVVERRWLDLFPGAGAVDGAKFGAGTLLKAELGVSGIFAANRADPLPSAAAIVGALTRLVVEAPRGIELSLDVKLGLDPDADRPASALAVERVRTLARLLAAIDPAQADIVVGVQRGEPSALALELRLAPRRIPAAPAIAGPGLPRPVAGEPPPKIRPGA